MEIQAESSNATLPLCCKAGYLPAPLRCVPAGSLSGIELYLASRNGYSLYSSADLSFGNPDAARLLDSGVEFVYISVRDHRKYYDTIEKSLENIISDTTIQEEKKSEILYATSIELSNQLLAAPPDKSEVQRASNLARATVQLIMKDKSAFGCLYDTFNHDFYTASHLVNVCGLTISAAQRMGMFDGDILQQVGTGAMLHDIGKVFVPREILNSVGKLTSSEFDIIKSHVNRGIEHLKKVMELPGELLAIIAEHHERMDGSGYPNGLKHDELSELGRLAGVVDSFDAMTSVRPYRSETFSVQDALQSIEDESPDKYDREIVHSFASLINTSSSMNSAASEGGQDSSENTGVRPRQSKDTVKHVHYCFRIPVVLRRMRKIGGKIILGPPERLIAHKMSCLNVGVLSDKPYKLDQNILITSPKLESVGLNKLWAVVTQCRSHGDGWYSVDAQFPNPYPPELVQKLKTITDVREVSALQE